jgi:hypothetical protein
MAPSPIECLPVELLQPIFIDSDYNVALLQASSRIGARLSSDYVYNATCAHYLDGVLEDRRAQSAAQTYIFASKWMTWAFLQSSVIRIYERNGCLCGLTADTGCFDAQWPPNFENATEMVFSRSHLPRIAFIRGRLPKKLLHGPWTPDKTQFLQFLLWITSMTVDWSDSEARQIAIEGRQQAIRESNLDAVALFNHNRRLGKVATLPLVRYAVIEGGCNRSIVYDTMSIASMGDSRLLWDCDELDKWCEDRIAARDPKGAWLKTKLEELRTPSRPGKEWQDDGIGYKRLFGGEFNSDAGNYDGGVDDQLVVKNRKWNQVSHYLPSYRGCCSRESRE